MIEEFKGDKSTVFSIVPFPISEFKPGIYPGKFDIEMCVDDNLPKRLVVGPSEYFVNMAEGRPQRLMTPSFQVANSIVLDFLNGQLWTSPNEHPGITWIHGEVSVSEFITKHQEKHTEMKRVQKNWYVRIIKETDNEWTKNHNTRVVTAQARFAAKVLGMEPEWLTTEIVGFETNKCPACSTPNAKTNIVCTNCRCVLDEKRFGTLKFAS